MKKIIFFSFAILMLCCLSWWFLIEKPTVYHTKLSISDISKITINNGSKIKEIEAQNFETYCRLFNESKFERDNDSGEGTTLDMGIHIDLKSGKRIGAWQYGEVFLVQRDDNINRLYINDFKTSVHYYISNSALSEYLQSELKTL
jgi:hypothetical protein